MGLCRSKLGIKTLHKTRLSTTFDLKKTAVFLKQWDSYVKETINSNSISLTYSALQNTPIIYKLKQSHNILAKRNTKKLN